MSILESWCGVLAERMTSCNMVFNTEFCEVFSLMMTSCNMILICCCCCFGFVIFCILGVCLISRFCKDPTRHRTMVYTELQTRNSTTMSSLDTKLLLYYENYAKIKDTEMTQAQEVFDIVKSEIADNLRGELRLQLPDVGIEEFIDTGSAKEGLKVVRPDEFDVMILYKLGREDEYEWMMNMSDERGNQAPGYVFICKSVPTSRLEARIVRPLLTITNQQGHLIPALLRDHFHGAFERIVTSSKTRLSRRNIQISLRPKGPSMQIDVKFGNYYSNKVMSIDFIPTIVIDGDWFVPKPYPACRKPEWESQNNSWQGDLWRWSYSRQEMNEISQFGGQGGRIGSDGHRKILMIIKSISLNHEAQFRLFSSYHYKTVLLYLMNVRSSLDDWTDNKLADRITDYFHSIVNFLEAEILPHYFDNRVNLLEGVRPQALIDLKCYFLERLRKKDVHLLLAPQK